MTRASLPVALTLALALPSCVDAEHDKQVDALGGEAPGIRPGPLHRPGQPCVTCHNGEGPGGSEFSVAGTAFLYVTQTDPAPGTVIQLEDVTGKVVTLGTNEAGNFYAGADVWNPTYPVHVTLTYGKVRSEMQTNIGRAGSCADCHKKPAGMTSPGQVYVALGPSALQKAMGNQ